MSLCGHNKFKMIGIVHHNFSENIGDLERFYCCVKYEGQSSKYNMKRIVPIKGLKIFWLGKGWREI